MNENNDSVIKKNPFKLCDNCEFSFQQGFQQGRDSMREEICNQIKTFCDYKEEKKILELINKLK